MSNKNNNNKGKVVQMNTASPMTATSTPVSLRADLVDISSNTFNPDEPVADLVSVDMSDYRNDLISEDEVMPSYEVDDRLYEEDMKVAPKEPEVVDITPLQYEMKLQEAHVYLLNRIADSLEDRNSMTAPKVQAKVANADKVAELIVEALDGDGIDDIKLDSKINLWWALTNLNSIVTLIKKIVAVLKSK